MLTVYATSGSQLERLAIEPGVPMPDNAIWLDLLAPSLEEDRVVEARIGVAVPTREEMQEIEVSSRLYVEEGARYMTAPVICHGDTDAPILTPVTFILAGKRLVTVRYDEPRSFPVFANRACRVNTGMQTGEQVLMGLLEAIIDRTADILERVGQDVDDISRQVFERGGARATRRTNYMNILRTLGRKGDLLSKARESLLGIGRIVQFLSANLDGQKVPKDTKGQLRSMARDVQSLNDHASYLGQQVTFLLDATLGMVSIEQNDIIKLFSVVSVVLMPPTLIASMYGMNFKFMPELELPFGYPMALVMMLISAIVPYLFFRFKRWL